MFSSLKSKNKFIQCPGGELPELQSTLSNTITMRDAHLSKLMIWTLLSSMQLLITWNKSWSQINTLTSATGKAFWEQPRQQRIRPNNYKGWVHIQIIKGSNKDKIKLMTSISKTLKKKMKTRKIFKLIKLKKFLIHSRKEKKDNLRKFQILIYKIQTMLLWKFKLNKLRPQIIRPQIYSLVWIYLQIQRTEPVPEQSHDLNTSSFLKREIAGSTISKLIFDLCKSLNVCRFVICRSSEKFLNLAPTVSLVKILCSMPSPIFDLRVDRWKTTMKC